MNINTPKMVEHKIESEEIKEAAYSKKTLQKPAKTTKHVHESTGDADH